MPGCPPEFAEHAAAERGVGQQRDGRQPASGALRPPGEAQGRQAGRGRSAAHQDRRTGGPARGVAARHRHAAGLVAGGRTGTRRRVRRGVHRRARARGRRVHGAGARMAGRARGGGVRRAAKRRSSPWRAGWRRPIRWCWRRATVWNAGATAAAASARRSRCRRCSASWATAAASCWAPAIRFRRRWRGCSGRTWLPPGTRTLNLIDVGRHLDSRRPRPAAARGVHLQPQSDRRASGPEPHAPRPGARGRVHRRHRRDDDREHGALRHRAAGGDQFRMRRPVCRRMATTGCNARSR